ncbi:MAG: cysteine synthase family protein [Acidobacteriota bacterium]
MPAPSLSRPRSERRPDGVLVEGAPAAPAAPVVTLTRSPLVDVLHPSLPAGVRVFAKLESVQAGGSIKDRPVSRIIERAIADGDLEPGGERRLLDSSSGNAGIAYAMIGARFGVPVTLVVPANASRERLSRIRSHGAELVLTDPMDGYDEAIRRARSMAKAEPEKYWYANQYGNANNWRAHYATTGAEILEQLSAEHGLEPDAFVCGVGTGGTFTGTSRRLLEANPEIHLAIAIPDIFPGIEGLKPLGAPEDIVPDILDESLIAERLDVTMEQAVEACHWLSGQGYFVGPSSGGNLTAALELASSGRFETVVTTFSDTGERYLSTGLWDLPA